MRFSNHRTVASKKTDYYLREIGWFPERIHKNLNAVILGMHAAGDNPELIRAKELGIHIYSFPPMVFASACCCLSQKRELI